MVAKPTGDMLSNGKHQVFVNCDASRRHIEKLIDDDNLVSAYHTCGVEPWLLIYQVDSLDKIFDLRIADEIELESFSISAKKSDAEKLVDEDDHERASQNSGKIIFWVTTKCSYSELASLVDGVKKTQEGVITEIREMFGSHNYYIKFVSPSINGIDSLLGLCKEKEIQTTTKCVLSSLKDSGIKYQERMRFKKSRSTEAKKDLEYAIARVMFNSEGFVQKSSSEQVEHLEDKLTNKIKIAYAGTEEIEKAVLRPRYDKSEYFHDDLHHPNKLVDRYSVKLKRGGWVKTLLYIKASHGNKSELESVIQEELLGVQTSRFSRKLYHFTGDYDFFIPLDYMTMEELDETNDWLWREYGTLISSMTSTICLPEKDSSGTGSLTALDKPFIESLLINSTNMDDLEDKIRSKKIFDPVIEDSLQPVEIGITPREDYIRNIIQKEEKPAIQAYLKNFKTFKEIGVESSIEFRDGALIQTLSKFHFKSPALKDAFLKNIDEKRQRFEVMALPYIPYRDKLSVICIIMVKDLVELEVMFDEFQSLCEKIEFHIIFHQRYYSKVLEQKIRCKPCFKPIIPKRDCHLHCNECRREVKDFEQSKKCLNQECGNCVRYILPRKENRILNIDLEKNEIKDEIAISLVGVDLKMSDYFALERSLDDDDQRVETFANYKRDSLSHRDQGFEDAYSAIGSRKEFRKKYRAAFVKVLKQEIRSEPDLIVFPEYAFPKYIYDEIRALDIKKDCIIVAGSYLEDGFNVCPIIHNEAQTKKVFHIYKNNLTDFEKKLNLVKHEGTAQLMFMNTGFGNVSVRICYDAYDINEVDDRTDVLLVPSYNTSPLVPDSLKHKAENYKLVAAYSNTINDDAEIRSQFFVPPRDGKQAEPLNPSSPHRKKRKNTINREIEVFHSHPADKEYYKENMDGFEFLTRRLTVNLRELRNRRGLPRSE